MVTYTTFEEERRGGPLSEDDSYRTPFARDRDRILYSSAFRALAGKTQVVSTQELGRFHTRLTHSLKVAQLGRVLANRLASKYGKRRVPDSDLIEAACLAHDIGHPPFGHAGEDELCKVVDEACRKQVQSDGEQYPRDGFEGNAQTFRIVSYLATRSDITKSDYGLDLTRATLRAITKYPWSRWDWPDPSFKDKWSAYSPDSDALKWVLRDRPAGQKVPIEEQVMDWCDDVTYACHDMEDFYKAGLIPLGALFPPDRHDCQERARFLDWLESQKWDSVRDGEYSRETAEQAFKALHKCVFVDSTYDGGTKAKADLHLTITKLISRFMDEVSVKGDLSPHSYNAELYVPEERRFECAILKRLAWRYVIKQRNLFSQQEGQRRIVRNLFEWHFGNPELLPPDRQEACSTRGGVLRTACDYVSGLSEIDAYELHRRLSGEHLGAVTDLIQ